MSEPYTPYHPQQSQQSQQQQQTPPIASSSSSNQQGQAIPSYNSMYNNNNNHNQLQQLQSQDSKKRRLNSEENNQDELKDQDQDSMNNEDEVDNKPVKVNQVKEKPLKESKGGASEFVKKLYRMLEDGNFADIVSWGFTGDTFVVKDMNSFTRSILPLHFKHSNFASFVRQLNKYDFHKVKNPDDGASPYGEHTWEFKHPNFRSDMKSSLEHIRRKAPAARKVTPTPTGARVRPPTGLSSLSSNLNSPPHDGISSPSLGAGDFASLQTQIESLHRAQQGMSQHMSNLSHDYQAVIGEMMSFQRNMVAQDSLMQNLIQYLVNLEADQKAASSSAQDPSTPFVPSSQAQKLITSYTEVARASYDQMADLSRRASLAGGGLPAIPLPPPGFGHLDVSHHGDYRGPITDAQRAERQQQQLHLEQTLASQQLLQTQNGVQLHQQQQMHQQQQQQQQMHQQQHPSSQHNHHNQPQQQQQPPQSQLRSTSSTNSLQIQHPNAPPLPPLDAEPSIRAAANKRATYVPGWAVPPRVLLVEDDAVCRKLSSKFLQVFGCDIDVAVDGVSAVNKMNLEKYDLVLMDIVMPNLDGVSATSLIRQFDPMTPIISMTSNSGPNEIMTYFSHGMNDILPKPFTKEGLLGMLEKHLIHLKVMQQMAEIPRALGFTDNQIQDALAVSAVSDEGTVLNPFSSMGISDGDYLSMLQGIALEKEGKKGLEVVEGRFHEVLQNGV